MTDRISARSAASRAPLYLALGCVGFLSSPALAEDGASAAARTTSSSGTRSSSATATSSSPASARSPRRIAQGDRRPARHAADRDGHQRPDPAPAESADPARRARHHPRHHLRRRRGRRRLWRFDQPARLCGEQRHHPGRRPRQRPVQPHRSVQPPADRNLQRRQFGVQRLGQRRRHDQPRLQGAAGRRSHHPLGARSAPTIISAAPSTPTGGSADTSRSASTPWSTATTSPAATSRITGAGASRPRSPSASAARPASRSLISTSATTISRSTASPISSTSSTTGRCPRPTTATISAIATSTSRRPRSTA